MAVKCSVNSRADFQVCDLSRAFRERQWAESGDGGCLIQMALLIAE